MPEKTLMRSPAGTVANAMVHRPDRRTARKTAILARANEVFGDSARAAAWLNTPVPALDDRKPISLLSSEPGAKRVEDALGRIEHGIF